MPYILEFEGPEQFSVFIGEPIQQAFGALKPPAGYWPVIREICDRYGILLIIDEVICGFGRTGRMFATEHCDVKPDMLTMAKGLTSGYVPLGAVGCTDQVMEPIEVFNHLHTYGNHPVPCAVGVQNIECLKRDRLVENSAAMGDYFLDGLRNLQDHPSVGEVRGTGLWLEMPSCVPMSSQSRTLGFASIRDTRFTIHSSSHQTEGETTPSRRKTSGWVRPRYMDTSPPRDEPHRPVVHPRFRNLDPEDTGAVFEEIRKSDILVHHPYHCFDTSVLKFLESAARDPSVLAIKITIYRTNTDSPIVRTLVEAVRRGKQVAVLVEITARFDEAPNIAGGKYLEKEGAHVSSFP